MGNSRRNRKGAGSEGQVETGRVLRLEVTGIAPGGWGVAQEGKGRYFVWGGLPGDRVEARVVRRERGRVEARVERLLEGRIPRIDPRCQHFAVCGGCLWQDLAYDDQLVLKKGIVVHCFREVGLVEVAVGDVVGAESVFFYRNRMDFSFGRRPSGGLGLGLFVSHRKAGGDAANSRGRMPPVFDLERCWLQSEASNRAVAAVRDALEGSGVAAYNPETRSGALRSLVIREGKGSGEVLVNLMVASAGGVPAEQVAEALTGAVGGVKGVVLSVNRKRSKHAAPKSQEVLSGRGWILERISGMDVEVSPTSFLQVNTGQAERLYDLAVRFADLEGGERVLDLYCGSGTLSLLLARRAGLVTGVEVVSQAVEDAKRNAVRNGIANCRFLCGDVLRVLPDLLRRQETADVVAVNPPRAGIYRAVVKAICRLRPRRVVYISCNPETLARDLVSFRAGGYRVEQVQPVDLFPHTPHCEVVVVMSRGGE